MKIKKLIVLFLGSALIAGIINYQLRRRPAPQSVSTTSAVETQPAVAPSAVDAPDAAATAAPTPDETAGATVALTAAALAQTISIPADGWDRNPFLSPKEIADLAAPPVMEIAEVTLEAPPPPPPLPLPEVTAIISNRQGEWAVVDSLVVRVGDRVGAETVRQILAESVVLEQDGRSREIPLKP